MPDGLARFFLLRSLIIKPGLETSAPFEAAAGYRQALEKRGQTLQGRRVLVLGYGGRFATACALLDLGAAHVVLCEYQVKPDHTYNRSLLPRFGRYLRQSSDRVVPDPQYITLVEGDIRAIAAAGGIAPADVVLSNSVFEHLEDVEGIAASLASLTARAGVNLHTIDLRDHFFKYPFEMLCYTNSTWRRWLNPTTNLNRYRVWQYAKAFESCFEQVEIEVLSRNVDAFEHTRQRIRPEFISGDVAADAVTAIRIFTSQPK